MAPIIIHWPRGYVNARSTDWLSPPNEPSTAGDAARLRRDASDRAASDQAA